MKVTFCLDNGANINSLRSQTFDTVKDLGMEEGGWEDMPEDSKYEMVQDWADNYIEVYFEESNK